MIDISNVNLYPYTFELSGSESLRRSTTSYGDGYAETRVKGIQPLVSSWEVTFFFTTLDAAIAFLNLLRYNYGIAIWKSPIDTSVSNYLITQWSISMDSPINTNVRCSLKKWYGN